jgi:hypothetical protein
MSVLIRQANFGLSSNGGRQLVTLSNGWKVSVCYDGNGLVQYFDVSKDGGNTWSQLCTLAGGYPNIALASSGTTIYVLASSSSSNVFNKFDATTVANAPIGGQIFDQPLSDYGSGGVSIYCAPDGSLHAVISATSSANPKFHIRYRKSTDGGATWAVTQVVLNSQMDFKHPSITTKSDSTPVITLDAFDINSWYYIQAFIPFNGGTSWTESSTRPFNPTDNNKSMSSPCVLTKKNGTNVGRMWCVWQGVDINEPTYSNIRANFSDDGGVNWQTPFKVTTGNTSDRTSPSLSEAPNGDVYVVYKDGAGLTRQKCVNGGTGFSSPVTFESNAQDPRIEERAAANGVMGIVLRDYTSGTGIIRLDTITFTKTVDTVAYDTSGNGGRRIVELSNGWLVASAFDSSNYRIYFYKSTDNGTTWSQLCYQNTANTSESFAVASSGTTVYVLNSSIGNYGNNGFAKFDATTVLNGGLSPVVSPDNGQSGLGSGCSLAVAPDGSLHAVWCSKNSTYPNSFNLRYSKSTDGGATWAAVTQLVTNNTSGTDCANPCIVVKSNNIPVIFSQLTTGSNDYRIYAFVYSGTATTWNTYAPQSSVAYSQTNPCAAIAPNGRIWVAWHGTDSTNSAYNNIRVSYSDDGGATWSAMQKLTSGNSYPQAFPSVAIDKNNNVYIYWSGYDSAFTPSYYNIRKISWNGVSWSAITTLTSNTTNHAFNPSAMPNQITNKIGWIWQDNQAGEVQFNSIDFTKTVTPNAYDTSGNGARKLVELSNGWLIAIAYDSTAVQLKYYKSTDNGLTWSQRAYAPVNASSGFAICSKGTNAYVFVTGMSAVATSFSFDVANDAITSPSPVNVDTGQTVPCGNCSIAVAPDGSIHAAWASKNSTYPSSNNIRYSKSTDGGTTWAAVTQVTGYSNNLANPSVVVKSDNYPVIFYQADASSGNSYIGAIFAHVYDGTSWVQHTVYNSGGTTLQQSNPSAAIAPNGRIWCSWHGFDTIETAANIRVSYSDDGGTTWSAMQKLTSGGSYPQAYPSVAIDRYNNVYIYWRGCDPALSASYYNVRKISWNGVSWSAITTLTSNTTNHDSNPSAMPNQITNKIGWIWQDNQAGYVKFDSMALATSTTTEKYWNGTAWVATKPLQYWNGTAMVPIKAIQRWNGTAFVDVVA